MNTACTWSEAFRLLNGAVFTASLLYLVLLFTVSLLATPGVMWLYRRRVLTLMSTANPLMADAGDEPTLAAPRLAAATAQATTPAALVEAATQGQRALGRVLLAACAVFSLTAGVLTTLSPDVVMDPQAALPGPRSLGLTALLALLDVVVIAALCMPLVLIGLSHPRFARLYWRRFVPLLLLAAALRVGLASAGSGEDRAAAGVANLLFVPLFYLAVARRHARQVAPLAGVLLGTVVGGLSLGGALLFLGVDCGGGLDVLLILLGLLVLPLGGLWLAWRAVNGLAHAYARKAFSDAQVQAASWLLCLTAISCLVVVGVDRGPAGPWLPLLLGATLAAVAIYVAGLRRLAPWPAPRSLLLLRVFAQDERGERLLDEAAFRWRFVGPIHMIGGPDLAQQSLEPHELLDFISGRAQQQFVTTREQLQQRLLTLDEAPDPDRRYRVNELFCQGEIWKTAVRSLVGRCDAVLLDLRGFQPERRGTAYEISLLALKQLLGKTVCLVDGDTDLAAVSATITAANPQARLEQARVLHAERGLDAEGLFAALAAAAAPSARPLPLRAAA
jgi:hypothetical protein